MSVLNSIAAGLLVTTLCGCGKESHSRDTDTNPPPKTIKLTARGGNVSVVAVGDLLLGSASTSQLVAKGYDWPFEQVKPLLGGADLAIGNLAAPITTVKEEAASEKEFAYQVKPASVPALKRAGFHALCLANDHVLDFGVAGMQETLAALRSNNLVPFGAGDSEREARDGVVFDFETLRIGVLGYGQKGSETKGMAKAAQGGFALLAEANLALDIPRMRRNADVVVVSLHWGRNYEDETDAQRRMGRRAIELGADIVYGHHPHIAQGIEIYRGKPILYSLGNFVFGSRGRFSKDKQAYGLVSRWLFEGKTLKWILATPITVNNEMVKFQPGRVGAEEARRAFEPLLQKYKTPVRWDGDTAFIGFGPGWKSAPLPRLPWVTGAPL